MKGLKRYSHTQQQSILKQSSPELQRIKYDLRVRYKIMKYDLRIRYKIMKYDLRIR